MCTCLCIFSCYNAARVGFIINNRFMGSVSAWWHTHTSRHTVVCRAAKKRRANTSVLFTRTRITPISASRIFKTTAPISTKFIYLMLYIYTTFHTKFEKNRASRSRDIRSQKSSHFLRIYLFIYFSSSHQTANNLKSCKSTLLVLWFSSNLVHI